MGNVKVSGLDATDTALQEPLRDLSEDFGALVNELSDRGYAWQSGALPAMRTADALSKDESKRLFALGSLEVKGGASLSRGPVAAEIAQAMQKRGWRLATPDSLEGATLSSGPLSGKVVLREVAEQRQRLTLEINKSGG